MTDDLIADAVAFAESANPRCMLGLAGAPAAGKSTLAKGLVAGVNERLGENAAAYLPMDGFHLSNRQLDRLGLRSRKGSPPSFDIHGYLALLRRVLTESDHAVYVPDYDRALHEAVAAGLVVLPETKLVITEGNYLASDEPVWRDIRSVLHELWYVDAPDAVREARLAARQVAAGKSPEQAQAWVVSNDRPNGELVKESRRRCSRVVRSGPY
ncbi:nucleoside/nucleotide kinase family protein [Streptomyces sp. NBC_01304]|uniref:nucleoside/nucleotide kinase family protein n=1 Tax=Streptomyces sp. NBC_01304 TaxID=2903818 RepID=UPI002E0D7457|nr:nucleoside/nucleotide kinase family protein [Streptomyces sp. NBC_01304]